MTRKPTSHKVSNPRGLSARNLDLFEERAAIMEFEAGFERDEAEALALLAVRGTKDWARDSALTLEKVRAERGLRPEKP